MFGFLITISLGGYFELLISAYLSIFSPLESVDHKEHWIVLSLIFSWVIILFLPVVFIGLQFLSLETLQMKDT